MQQALDALKYHTEHTYPFHLTNVAIEALQKALAQPEQEPACWITPDGSGFMMRCEPPDNDVPLGWAALYTALPRKEWVGLTNNELQEIFDCGRGFWTNAAKIEQLLKNKNT
jgi:hypothetical protein